MLSTADLEANVLEFRQKAFQFEGSGEVEGTDYVVFGRTETESERRLRPRLVHLKLVAPRAWVVHDEAADVLRVADPSEPASSPSPASVLEVAAEPSAFREGGVEWTRTPRPSGTLVYLPRAAADTLRRPGVLEGLGVP